MERGWDATGRLEALWGRVGGRDKLADRTGIQPGTLSGYNTGRLRLGLANAEKIAAALDCTLQDLGQAAKGATGIDEVLAKVETLEASVESLRQEIRAALKVAS